MKIAVCGCSYSAVSHLPAFKGSHWSELLASLHGYTVLNFSLQACSNTAIRLQIDAAVASGAEVIIVSPTFSSRIDIPINARCFEPILGLDNLISESASIRSITIEMFLQEHPKFEEYYKYFYDDNLKTLSDKWSIRDGINFILANKIKVLIQPQNLWESINSCEDAIKFLNLTSTDVLSDNDSIFFLELSNPLKKNEIDPGYHTTRAVQKLFVEKLLKYLR